jgi:hypothetical protein
VRCVAGHYYIGATEDLFDVYAVEAIVLIAELAGNRHIALFLKHL